MRLPGSDRDCGPLLELGQIQQRLRLAAPVIEGGLTIPVASIIGTVNRGGDFDGCWHPMRPHLARRIDEIIQASPPKLEEPIDVVRVDRAYFVADGHKRVAIARRTGREFIDARVSHMPSPYEMTADIEGEAIERTAREGEFRRHSGIAEGVPDARFALSNVDEYGELLEAVQLHGYRIALNAKRLPSPADVAADWYASVYLPSVAISRERTFGLLDSCTDADVFLGFRRQARAFWGTECDAANCAADQMLAERRRSMAHERSPIGRLLGRGPNRTPPPAQLLPFVEADDSA